MGNFVEKKLLTEFHENLTKYLIVSSRLQTNGRDLYIRNSPFYFLETLKIYKTDDA